jgi:hypothetical protein
MEMLPLQSNVQTLGAVAIATRDPNSSSVQAALQRNSRWHWSSKG